MEKSGPKRSPVVRLNAAPDLCVWAQDPAEALCGIGLYGSFPCDYPTDQLGRELAESGKLIRRDALDLKAFFENPSGWNRIVGSVRISSVVQVFTSTSRIAPL